ncbi:uncharacterized protein NEMAJ01_0885 [Nematocida major]|uniref:uncharacterized protein n=1 Tax=Nematocida major TaxID=1912982 RepID=UPI0020089F07|nr:uncharacterized protein NEMAJ01_0885 [Nematocida major]KAH9385989.1 hypothetical protein NEMAJ01_0885 [Nematocida major]
MNFSRIQNLQNCSSSALSEMEHCEKLTCVSDDEKVYGGFLGGLYKTAGLSPQRVAKINSPVSFIARGPRAPDELSPPGKPLHAACAQKENSKMKEESAFFSKYIIGDWDGNIHIGGQKIKVSEGAYPIKCILPIEHGVVACDPANVYVWQNGAVFSARIGAWPLALEVLRGEIVATTGYTVHYLRIQASQIKEIARVELQRDSGHTETLTCIDRAQKTIGGSIGGWIMRIEDKEDQARCRLSKVMKLSEEKLTGISAYEHRGSLYYICSTGNSVFIVDAKQKRVLETFCIAKDHGVFYSGCIRDEKLALLAFNRNFTVYRLQPSVFAACVPGEPAAAARPESPAKSGGDAYEELLKELNEGAFD